MTKDYEVRRIKLADVIPDPNNPRKDFDEEKIRALADSFIANNGEPFTPPIVVACGAGKYRIIDGERRYRAMLLDGELEDAAFMVASDAEAGYAMAAMLATDSKEKLTEAEKAMGVQQAIMYDMDDRCVDGIAGMKRGSAAKLRRCLSYRDEPVRQTTLDKLFEVAEIDDALEREQLLDMLDEGKDSGYMSDFRRKLNGCKSLQRNKSYHNEIMSMMHDAGVDVVDEAPESGYKFWKHLYLANLKSGAVKDIPERSVVVVSKPDGYMYGDGSYEAVHATVYAPVDEGDEERTKEDLEREARESEFDDATFVIRKSWASFIYSVMCGESDPSEELEELIRKSWDDNCDVSRAKSDGYDLKDSNLSPLMFPFVLDEFIVFSYFSWLESAYVDCKPAKYEERYCTSYISQLGMMVDSGYEPLDFEKGLKERVEEALGKLAEAEGDEDAEDD